jgi:anti-sigma factor RsiW
VRCSWCEPLLDRYVEGTLSAREMRDVRTHVDRCAACASLVVELRVVDALLATTKPIELAPNFTFALMAEARGLPVRAQRRLSLWTALSFYTLAAWMVLTGAYFVFDNHGVRLAELRSAAAVSASQSFAAFSFAAHGFGTSTPLVLGGVVSVLVIDALLALAGLTLFRALRSRARRPEAL